ncbi:TonB-dependent receptor [Tenacibaculum sp. M341]|uniref:TonB-dependent receptor n=1 Tax=Tenacibaculum sp. M341 TaxID=2530339 RepID=UPI0010484AA8|nr:carboxypeptidase-like regulatory domain-containing protein [Tenacibaculum sp. M341]TCI85868.1 TonB-dependent receptor [Tenacibaculum sp. M341]
MRNFKNLLLLALLFISATVLSQSKLTGTVVDEMGQPLPSASVIEKGTMNGVETDFDGNFTLNAKSSQGTVVVSFVGYAVKELKFTGAVNFGEIQLAPSNELDEIVVTATSLAIDRKTPVAVSTVKAADIERKLGTQEFPEILKSTPGVYATRSGGGFGDGRINLRGFNSVNIGVMINGVPVNDMENGRVFWSNWAGLGDVTSVMQVQRGLGASKVAVPSVGGTINIVTKSTDIERGGNIIASTGNDGYQKYGFTLSTGKMENGFASTVSVSKVSGQGFVDGTEFEGWNYFANISKEINDRHTISLTTFGAPQRHGQRQNRSTIDTYRRAESGIRFNPDWGLRDGNVVHVEDNFYHKNQTSLNHYWDINDKTSLSTALYFSIGRGGGGARGGSNINLFQNRIGGADQPIDIDNIVSINRANGTAGLGSEAVLLASKNEHEWYGGLTTFKTELVENLDFVGGVDIRHYKGLHYRELTDLLGGSYYWDVDSDGNQNDVNNVINPREKYVGDVVSYNNDGIVDWQGVFTQFEYSKGDFNAFLSTAISNTSYKRIDYFNYLATDPNRETDTYSFLGYSVKGGANYKIDGVQNVFANVGYFERAPFFNGVFTRFDNEASSINADADTEKILSFELGYGVRAEKFAANLNVYRTEWRDRNLSTRLNAENGEQFSTNIPGVDALHQGVEVDFTWKPTDYLTVTGMGSLGDWKWASDIYRVPVFDPEQQFVGEVDLLLDGVRVGDAAQTTAALGLLYKFWEKSSLTVDYNYFGELYSDFSFSQNFTSKDRIEEIANDPTLTRDEPKRVGQPWKMPNYHTFDASIRHGFNFGDFDTTLTLRVNNIFDTEYISDAQDVSGTAASALVWYGAGRTFSLGAKIKF